MSLVSHHARLWEASWYIRLKVIRRRSYMLAGMKDQKNALIVEFLGTFALIFFGDD